MFVELSCDRRADSATRARHDRDLAFERHSNLLLGWIADRIRPDSEAWHLTTPRKCETLSPAPLLAEGTGSGAVAEPVRTRGKEN